MESRRSLNVMIELLRESEGIVIFPEGTYHTGGMGSGHIGLVRMVLSRIAIPFIPVGIGYSKGRWRTLARISIGRPIYGDSPRSVNKVIDHAMEEIAKLSGL